MLIKALSSEKEALIGSEEEPIDVVVTEIATPPVTRRGPYWSTPEFDSRINFEAALIRFLRDFGREQGFEHIEISRQLDRLRSGFSKELFRRWEALNDPIVFLIAFLDQWKKISRQSVFITPPDGDSHSVVRSYSYDARLSTDALEALSDAKRRLRNPRKFMADESYWPPVKGCAK